MIRVAGIWELGWNTPIKEIELWEYPLRDFSVDEFFMCPISGIQSGSVKEVPQLDELIVKHRNLGIPIVFVDERGEQLLQEFKHPEDVLYIFGKASLNPLVAYGQPGDKSVRIETIQNKGLLWPHQAAGILLYDRLVKSWR